MIDFLSWFALVVLVFLVVLAVFAAIALAKWPGRIARDRGHPQADAINVCAWLGILLTAGAAWIVAMVWAHLNPIGEED